MKTRLLLLTVLVLSFALSSVLNGSPLPAAPDCQIFPATNVWNKEISQLPVHSNSRQLITTIGLDSPLHPDFSKMAIYGIPYNVVAGTAPKVSVQFDYADESNKGPYPIPAQPKMEAGSDRHILIVDKDNCRLYEIYDARKVNGKWFGGSGAIWSLASNQLRPDGWTSADAAGLPILPGLVRFDEVAKGVINHAIRFTAPRTRTFHIYPARHHAGESNSTSLPPMGLRVRLKASVNISGFSPRNRVILTALKKYGMLLADNGSSWFIQGAPNAGWNDDDLRHLTQITGKDFEAVDTHLLRNGP
jgi:hypothetical protein